MEIARWFGHVAAVEEFALQKSIQGLPTKSSNAGHELFLGNGISGAGVETKHDQTGKTAHLQTALLHFSHEGLGADPDTNRSAGLHSANVDTTRVQQRFFRAYLLPV
jgi:hypothetical protein